VYAYRILFIRCRVCVCVCVMYIVVRINAIIIIIVIRIVALYIGEDSLCLIYTLMRADERERIIIWCSQSIILFFFRLNRWYYTYIKCNIKSSVCLQSSFLGLYSEEVRSYLYRLMHFYSPPYTRDFNAQPIRDNVNKLS